MGSRIKAFSWFTIGAAAALLLPVLAMDGMFMDGMLYSAVAHNLANGYGSFWFPRFSEMNVAGLETFHEHPPLIFGLQAIWFEFFGSAFWVERTYSLLMAIITAGLIVLTWRSWMQDRSEKSLVWLPLLLWIIMPTVHWCYHNNMMETTMAVFTTAAVLFSVKARERMFWPGHLLAGLMVFFAVMAKGIPGLFPIAAPAFIAMAATGLMVAAAPPAAPYYQPDECPLPGAPAPPAQPGNFNDYKDRVAGYLSAGGSPTVLEAGLREWGAINDTGGVVQADTDLTGDGVREIIVTFFNPQTFNEEAVLNAGQMLVLGCDAGGYRVLYETPFNPLVALPELLRVGDMNADVRSELVFFTETCGRSNCYKEGKILTWNAQTGAFKELNNGQIVAINGRIGIADVDDDGVLELTALPSRLAPVVHGRFRDPFLGMTVPRDSSMGQCGRLSISGCLCGEYRRWFVIQRAVWPDGIVVVAPLANR